MDCGRDGTVTGVPIVPFEEGAVPEFPVEPVEPDDPVEPVDPADPVAPVEPVDSDELDEPVEPVEPVELVELVAVGDPPKALEIESICALVRVERDFIASIFAMAV